MNTVGLFKTETTPKGQISFLCRSHVVIERLELNEIPET